MILMLKKDSEFLFLKNNIRSAYKFTSEVFCVVEISRLFWKKAYTSDAFLLGEVESAELDMSTWQIKNLYVGLTDEATRMMGFKRPFLGKVIVCLPVSTIKSYQDTAILNQTIAELRNLKECKES
jgi:sporulation protein YlmC with PRC-barrel domain